jgi:hypothetical protein
MVHVKGNDTHQGKEEEEGKKSDDENAFSFFFHGSFALQP